MISARMTEQLLRSVKMSLRINHDALDMELREYIETAKSEMIRVGVRASVANNVELNLIRDAIKTFCKMRFETDVTLIERYEKSWQYQLDMIRKSKKYWSKRVK